jgi:broad specificity phosphatase PhoE
MKRAAPVRRGLATLALFLAGAAAAAEPTAVLFLVRHAERADDSADAPLAEAGKTRAAELARLLGEAGLTGVLSTNYTRTRDTAAPLAAALGLPVELYDARDLPAAAAALRARGGRLLVVGHSDTTPALVAALGGDAGPPIAATEHDRLYVVTLVPGQPPLTARLRFGARSTP